MSLLMATAMTPASEGGLAPPSEVRETDPHRQQTRVLLFTSEVHAGESQLGARVRRTSAELEVSGLEPYIIAVADSEAELDQARLEAFVREHRPVALVVFDPRRARAELWTVNDQGMPTQMAVIVGDAVAQDNDAVLAVRIAETLQALLLRLPRPPEPRPLPPPPPPSTSPPGPPYWAVRLGLHGVGSARWVGPMFGPTFAATLWPGQRRHVGLDIEVVSTALPGRVEDIAGSATVGLTALRVVAQWWPRPSARFSPAIGVGAGPLLAWTRGSAVAPFTNKTDMTVVGIPTGAADLAVRLTSRLRLRLGVRLGVALPIIRIQTTTTTEVARPLFDSGFALELTPRSADR